jgi:hypothetical protein
VPIPTDPWSGPEHRHTKIVPSDQSDQELIEYTLHLWLEGHNVQIWEVTAPTAQAPTDTKALQALLGRNYSANSSLLGGQSRGRLGR